MKKGDYVYYDGFHDGVAKVKRVSRTWLDIESRYGDSKRVKRSEIKKIKTMDEFIQTGNWFW